MTAHLRRSWTSYSLLLLMAAGLVARLVYAVPDLHGGRFWDERYSLRNVRSLVAWGQIRPQNGYYPSLSYLPHAALIAAGEGLHRSTGIEPLAMLDPEGPFGFSRSAILAARLVSVIAGTLTIGLVFLLGRRLASPVVGLLAAGILSASWTHLLVSVRFKPDVLAVLVAVVAFWWILDVLERPGAARFALAGVGVGLSASTKYLGASIAFPLVVAAVATAGRELRTWSRLALAGVVSMATFVVLNPWLGLIVHDMGITRRDYANKALAAGATHWTVLSEELDWIWRDHRWAIAVFVLLGCAGLAARSAGRLEGRLPRAGAIAVLAAILGHSAFLATVTRHFEPWNYLPVLPFTALASAWAMAGLAERLVARLAVGARGPVRAALGGAVAALVLVFPVSVTYAGCVPTTWELAERSLSRLELAPARIVYAEGIRTEVERGTARPRFLLLEVESIQGVSRTHLDRADAVVFPARRLEGLETPSYTRWLGSDHRSVTRIESRPFRARGPSLLLVQHRWELRGEVLHWPIEGQGGPLRLSLPEPLRAGEVVSLAVDVWRGPGRPFPGAVQLEGAAEAPLYQLQEGRRAWMATPRLLLGREQSALAVRLLGIREGVLPLEIKLYRWERSGVATAHRHRLDHGAQAPAE